MRVRRVFGRIMIWLAVLFGWSWIGLFMPNMAKAAGESWLTGFRYRNQISIDHTKVGAGTENESNFPLLVSVSGLSNINANGTDIRFTSDDGSTQLPREIESYSAGNLVAWVKVPTLSYTADTVLYMYYGSSLATEPAATSDYGKQNVWTGGYSGVWHLSEPSGTQYDSTSHGHNSTTVSVTAQGTTGKIGGADQFTRADNTVVMFEDSADWCSNTGSGCGNTATIEAWCYFTSLFSESSACFAQDSDSIPWGILALSTATPANAISVIFKNNSWASFTVSGSDAAPTDGWHHIAGTLAGNTITMYIDGAIAGSRSDFSGTILDGIGTASLGAYNGGADQRHMSGYADEARYSSVSRTAGWIATEYNNQNSPQTFLSLAAQETRQIDYGLHFQGNKLVKADNSHFVIKGVNVEAYRDYVNGCGYVTDNLFVTNGSNTNLNLMTAKLKSLGVNAVRLAYSWEYMNAPGYANLTNYLDIAQTLADAGIYVMPVDNSYTGTNFASRASAYPTFKAIVDGFQNRGILPYLIFNPLGEPANVTWASWVTINKDILEYLRNTAGYTGPVFLDSIEWASGNNNASYQEITDYDATLLGGQANVGFDNHWYPNIDFSNVTNSFATAIDYPLTIGELGQVNPGVSGTDPDYVIDVLNGLIDTGIPNGHNGVFGWMWNWCDNNTMTTAWDNYTNLNAYGQLYVDYYWDKLSATQTPTAPPVFVPSYSPSASFCNDSQPVDAPNLFQIDTTENKATLYFSPVPNNTRYYISYSTKPIAEEHGTEINLGSEGVQSWTVNLLAPGTRYYFKVRGQNGCMPGKWSNIRLATTKPEFISQVVPDASTIETEIDEEKIIVPANPTPTIAAAYPEISPTVTIQKPINTEQRNNEALYMGGILAAAGVIGGGVWAFRRIHS